MSYIFREFNKKDIETVKKQLEVDTAHISGIVERCKWEYPVIILLHPVRSEGNDIKIDLNYKFISNLLWLTCPYLNKKIHNLESEGWVKRIENFIMNDRGSISKMKYAHVHYFYLRKKVYRHFLGDITSIDENSRIFNAGIGGISDTRTLKCLHLHYAHYKLCSENYAGKITDSLLNGDSNCKERICEYETSSN